MTAAAQASRSGTGSGKLGRKHFILIFAALVLSMFVSSLSETIAATALPTIAGDLKGMEIMQWVSTSYILTSSIAMPIYGRLGDTFGRRNLLISSIVLYAAGKVLCGIAPDMGVLIAGRCISGVGGGGIPILAQSAMSDIVPPRKLGTYIGIMGSILTLSMVLGPIMGGWFVDTVGWRWIFWFTVPLSLISAVPVALFLPQKSDTSVHASPDWAGMVLLAAVTSAFVLTAALAGDTLSWASPITITLIAVFFVSLWLFIRTENRAAHPIIPLTLFRDRNFVLCSVGGLLINIGIMGVMTYLPTYFQIVDNMNPALSGMMFTPMALGSLAASTVTGLLATKYGKYKWMTWSMGLITAFAFWLLSTMRRGESLWLPVLYLTILGTGLGIGLHILTLIVQNEFSHAVVGTATGANRFFRQIGSTLGAAIVGSMFTARLNADLAGKIPRADHLTIASITPQVVDRLPDATRTAIAHGYSEALIPLFVIFVPVALACFVLMLFLKENKLATTINHEAAQQTQG